MPHRVPERMSEEMPDTMLQRMSEDLADRMPERISLQELPVFRSHQRFSFFLFLAFLTSRLFLQFPNTPFVVTPKTFEGPGENE